MMTNDVKILKLITGEEIIARVKQDGDMLSLNIPMTLQPIPQNKTGQVGMALIPWIFSGKSEEVKISLSHVIAEDDAKEQHEKNYLQAVTGLTL